MNEAKARELAADVIKLHRPDRPKVTSELVPSEPQAQPARCSMADGSVFPLRTLRDIFELPSYEHMERCLDELKTVMLQARATNDLFAGLMEHQGKPMPDGKCFLWPEVLEWNDDGKGEIGADYVGPDGKPFLSMRTVKASSPNIKMTGAGANKTS